jgi:hypothetical protein
MDQGVDNKQSQDLEEIMTIIHCGRLKKGICHWRMDQEEMYHLVELEIRLNVDLL